MDPIRQPIRAVLPALTILLAAGCVSPIDRSVPEARLRDTAGYALVIGLNVPAVRGAEGCGSQALAMMMAFRAPGLDSAALADALPWHEHGATPVDVLLAAREHGFPATIERGSIEALAARLEWGEPVLVMFDAAPAVRTLTGTIPTIRVMHWSVVSGIAQDGSRVLLAARDARHHLVDRKDFLRRWKRSDYCTVSIGTPAITGHETAAGSRSGR